MTDPKPATPATDEMMEDSKGDWLFYEAEIRARIASDAETIQSQAHEIALAGVAWQEREEEFHVLDNRVDTLREQVRVLRDALIPIRNGCGTISASNLARTALAATEPQG